MTSPSLPAGWYPAPDGSPATWWWDGQAWTPTQPDPRTRKPLAGLALATHVLLVVSAVLALVTVGSEILGIVASTRYLAGSDSAFETIEAYDAITLVVAILSAVALIATAVVWLIWQYRVATRVVGRVRRSPGWHVWSWIIPVVSLWFPYQNISDLWRAAGRSRPGWQPLWWSLWIASSIATSVSNQMYARATTLEDLVIGMWASLIGALLLLAAAPFAMLIVRDVTRSYK